MFFEKGKGTEYKNFTGSIKQWLMSYKSELFFKVFRMMLALCFVAADNLYRQSR